MKRLILAAAFLAVSFATPAQGQIEPVAWGGSGSGGGSATALEPTGTNWPVTANVGFEDQVTITPADNGTPLYLTSQAADTADGLTVIGGAARAAYFGRATAGSSHLVGLYQPSGDTGDFLYAVNNVTQVFRVSYQGYVYSPLLTRTTPAATTGASVAGLPVGITAGPAVASTDTAGAANGGDVPITTGAAARNTSGNGNGGNVVFNLGAGIGTGTRGQILIEPTANFSTNPSIAPIGGTNTGMSFRAGALGNIYFYTSGAGALTLSSTGVSAGVAVVPSTNNTIDLGSTTHWRSLLIDTSIQGGGSKTLTDNVATNFVKVAVAQGASVAFNVRWTVKVIDAGLDQQVERGRTAIACINKGGTVTCATPVVSTNTTPLVTAGTLAATAFAVAEVDADTVTVSATSDTSLTPSPAASFAITYFVECESTCTVTQL